MKKIILLIVALGLFILFGFYYIKNQNNNTFRTDYILETPNISDKNLSQFYLWTIEDPLFTSPGFDSAAFSEAIVNLIATENAYIKQFKLINNIYPDSFLQDLIAVNKAHNAFINNPTLVNANNLIAIYKTTVTDYESGIVNLQLPIKSFIVANSKIDLNTVYFEGIDTVTNLKIVNDDLEKIKLNASILKEEISKRQACLGHGIGCQRPVNNFSKINLVDKSYSFTKKDILPKDFFYKAITPPPGGRPQQDVWMGPYIVSTQCLGWSDDFNAKPYLFYLITNSFYNPPTQTQESFPRFFYKVATDRYFRNLDVLEKKKYGDERKRIMQTETNDYMCPNQEYKIKINSINYLVNNYKDKQIFSTLLKSQGISGEAKEFIAKGESLEKKFFNSEFPSDTDADNLVNYYGLLYQKIITWNQQSEYKKDTWLINIFNHRMDILNEYLGYKRGLIDVDKLVKSIAMGLDGLRLNTISRQNENGDIRPQVYTYMVRSKFELFYFPFSKSFYRYDKSLDYLVKVKANNVGPDKHFITYLEALKYYSIEEIKSWYFPQGRK